jgi:hypothetical protein
MANEKTLLKIPQICIVFPVNSTREMNSLLEYSSVNSSLEKFEDTKRVSIRKSKKYRQYNGQKIPTGVHVSKRRNPIHEYMSPNINLRFIPTKNMI